MVIQEHGNLSNYVLMKGESKGVIEVKELKSREIIYTKIRVKVSGGTYVSRLLDPITQAVLAEVQGKKSSAKLKQLLLYQPDDCIELKDSGILTFEYKFFWENEKYVWKKRNIVGKELECKMVHGDDPGMGVCIYKQESKTLGCITIMYYNMERIPVNDKKGLEHLLVISLLSILDKWDDDNITKSKNEFDESSEILKGKLLEEKEREKEKKKDNKERDKEREKEKEKKKDRNKKDEKLKLAEEEAALQEKLRQLKAQEKEDEEYARKLQLKFSDPNYNEEEEETPNYGKLATSNNSRKDSIRPTSTYSPDNSTGYKFTEPTINTDKRLRPPTPPSSYSSSKLAQNYSSASMTPSSNNSSSEQEEYYRNRPPPPTPPSTYPSSSPTPNLYPPPSWDLSSYSNPLYYNTNTNPNNEHTPLAMPMPSIPGQYNNGTAVPASSGGYYDPQFNNNYTSPPASNINYGYPPYYGNTNNNGYYNGYNGYNGYSGGGHNH